MRPQGSQNRETHARRRALLDAALAELTERGLHGATMESICARVGVTRGSAYHHFANKERIAVGLCAEALDAVHTEARLGFTGGKGARDRVEGLVRGYLGWFERHPPYGMLVFTLMDGDALGDAREELRRMSADIASACAAWVAPFVASGEVRALPPALFAPVILGPSRDFLRGWLRRPAPRTMRDAKRELPGVAWQSVATRPRRA